MSTLTVDSKEFPTGILVPNSPQGTIVGLSSGASGSLTAPATIFGNPQLQEPTFDFLFWDANATFVVSPTAPFTAPADNSDFEASAWYLQRGGGPPGGPGVLTFAFALNEHKVVAGETPIASVTPVGAWSGPPSTVVSTTLDSVVITARDRIGGHGRFSQWFVRGSGTALDRTLTVLQNESCLAIAFYRLAHPNIEKFEANNDPLSPGRTILDVTGKDFTPGGRIKIEFTSNRAIPSLSAVADPTGKFITRRTLKGSNILATGATVTVTATDQSVGTASATTTVVSV